MFSTRMFGIRKVAGVLGTSAVLVAGGSYALASTSTPAQDAAAATSVTYHGCVRTSGTPERLVFDVFTSKVPRCPKGSFAVSWNQQGPKGNTGATGAQGPAGPSGVVSTKVTDLGAVASVPTGGSFVTNATEVGTVSLGAGTYLLSLNAKATPPSGGTGTMAVFPQFFVYNQAANASFAGDLFNVGSGPLEEGTNSQIDSYFSGSGEITVPAGGETLHVYAFGYDSDRGAGSYVLDDLSVTTTSLTTGS